MAAILGLAIMVLSVKNTQREREYMTRNMVERAEALIWALEAGTRTWMTMHHRGEPKLLQSLVEETAKHPGVVYMAVIDSTGEALAHSDSARVGTVLKNGLPPLSQSNKPSWRLLDQEEDKTFEVYRAFAPAASVHGGTRGPGGCDWRQQHSGPQGWRQGQEGRRHGRPLPHDPGIVLVGLDQKPFEEALREDFRNNVFSAVLIAAIALAGVISLFWAHHFRQSRRMLKDSLAMSSEVVVNLPLGLVTGDPDGNIAVINPAALAMFNTSRESAINAPLHSLPGLNWGEVSEALARRGKIFEQEMTLSVPGIRPISVTLSAAAMRNEDGAFLGNLFIVRDVTEMKRLQADAQRNDRLTALGRLASGVAHEVRNPLSTIKGVAMYLARRMPSGGREEEAAGRMIDEVGRLDRVVSELLEFAQPGTVTAVETDLRDVIDRGLRLVEADIKAKDIIVQTGHDQDVPAVLVDPERFTQVLLNLYLNAIQAMKRGGVLRVTTRRQPDGFSALSVSDTGPGIPEEHLASVFTPYFTTKSSGTGLGLAIAHQIVEKHGGTVSVENIPGSGAEFIIKLPNKNGAQDLKRS
jgi:two-component system sensor histidine kinase HydH